MTRATKSNSFENLLASYMNTLRFVRDRFGNFALAMAFKTKCVAKFLYFGIAGVLVRKGGHGAIRWP